MSNEVVEDESLSENANNENEEVSTKETLAEDASRKTDITKQKSKSGT